MNREERIQSIIENMAKCQRPALKNGWHKLGLSHAQMGVLYLLYYHQPASAKQAADYLGISQSAITQLADPLVSKSLVLRQNDPADRRVVRLSLTPKGNQLLKKLSRHKFAGMRSALDGLDDQEIEQLQRLYQKMIQDLK